MSFISPTKELLRLNRIRGNIDHLLKKIKQTGLRIFCSTSVPKLSKEFISLAKTKEENFNPDEDVALWVEVGVQATKIFVISKRISCCRIVRYDFIKFQKLLKKENVDNMFYALSLDALARCISDAGDSRIEDYVEMLPNGSFKDTFYDERSRIRGLESK
jgi:hypothetical protein